MSNFEAGAGAGDGLIHTLPEELLRGIIELSLTLPIDPVDFKGDDDGFPKYDKSTSCSLALVSRRFNLIATPFLYAALSAVRAIDSEADLLKLRLLHRTLKENPRLRGHCIKLTVDIYNATASGRDVIGIVHDFASWMPALQNLSIGIRSTCEGLDGMYQDSWDVVPYAEISELVGRVAATTTRTGLNRLSLHCNYHYLLVSLLFETLTTLPMKELHVTGLVLYDEGTDQDKIAANYRKATFSALCITNSPIEASDLAVLLDWPRTLRHLRLSSSGSKIDINALQALLLRRKDELQTLDLGELGVARDHDMLNTADFVQLTALKSKRVCFPAVLDYDNVNLSFLLAPRLGKFVWDFHSSRWNRPANLRRPEGLWLKRLIYLASRQGLPLQQIRVECDPPQAPYADDYYRLETREAIRRHAKRHNIQLEYVEEGNGLALRIEHP